MDFLIGIILVIITIVLLYNFATISVSNSAKSANSGTCNQNYTISSMQAMGKNQKGMPRPVLANSPVSGHQPIYDYNKYFYV